jgi:hypothetical protein
MAVSTCYCGLLKPCCSTRSSSTSSLLAVLCVLLLAARTGTFGQKARPDSDPWPAAQTKFAINNKDDATVSDSVSLSTEASYEAHQYTIPTINAHRISAMKHGPLSFKRMCQKLVREKNRYSNILLFTCRYYSSYCSFLLLIGWLSLYLFCLTLCSYNFISSDPTF